MWPSVTILACLNTATKGQSADFGVLGSDLVCRVQRPQHQAIDMEGRSSDARPGNASQKVGHRSAAVAGSGCVREPDAATVSATTPKP